MRYVVKSDFWDIETGALRKAGESIDVTPARAEILASKGLICLPERKIEKAVLPRDAEKAVRPSSARKPRKPHKE